LSLLLIFVAENAKGGEIVFDFLEGSEGGLAIGGDAAVVIRQGGFGIGAAAATVVESLSI